MNPQNTPQPQPQPTNDQPTAPHNPGQTFSPQQSSDHNPTVQQTLDTHQSHQQLTSELSGKKPNPPIAAQILFGLTAAGFLLYTISLIALNIFVTSSAVSAGVSYITFLIFGILSLSLFIAWSVRQGKLWALIVETVLLGLSAVSLATGDTSSLFGIIVFGPLLAILWTRNRSYFN
jgi:hypothetical protein